MSEAQSEGWVNQTLAQLSDEHLGALESSENARDQDVAAIVRDVMARRKADPKAKIVAHELTAIDHAGQKSYVDGPSGKPVTIRPNRHFR